VQAGTTLVVDLEGIVHGIARLSIPGAAPHSNGAGTHRAAAAKASIRAAASTAAPPVQQPPAWRLRQAREAGGQAFLKLAGRIPRVLRLQQVQGEAAKTFFVIVRGARGEVGLVRSNWPGVARYVLDAEGRIAREVIFAGFHTQEEASIYFQSARPGEALVVLPSLPPVA